METPIAIEIPMIRFIFNLLDESSAQRAFHAATLPIAVAVPCSADDRDRDVGCDSGGDPDAHVTGGGADGRAHGGSESDGQAE